jgi:hypothetical protein
MREKRLLKMGIQKLVAYLAMKHYAPTSKNKTLINTTSMNQLISNGSSLTWY